VNEYGQIPEEELAMIPDEELDFRCSPLFVLCDDFQKVFCDYALDVLGLSDEDADRLADVFGNGRDSPYPALLRSVKTARMLRKFAAKMQAVAAANPDLPSLMSFPDLQRAYDDLSKGDA
jgi:hypothetical protein